MIDLESVQVRGHEVRLCPTVRIGTDSEEELPATAAVSSMVRAVSEFERAIRATSASSANMSARGGGVLSPKTPNAFDVPIFNVRGRASFRLNITTQFDQRFARGHRQ